MRRATLKGILSALLMFIFFLFFVPGVAALIIGGVVAELGEKWVSIGGPLIVVVIIVCIPLSVFMAWKRYKKVLLLSERR